MVGLPNAVAAAGNLDRAETLHARKNTAIVSIGPALWFLDSVLERFGTDRACGGDSSHW
jgi:hypothetical protein